MPRVTPLRVPERYDVSTPPNERRREGRPLAEVLTDVLMHRPISERENTTTRHLRRRFQDPEYEPNSDSESNEYESADSSISEEEIERPQMRMSDLSIQTARLFRSNFWQEFWTERDTNQGMGMVDLREGYRQYFLQIWSSLY